MTMLLGGEATKKVDRCLGESDCCLRISMAAVGEWRDEVGCSKLTSVSLERAVHY